MTAIITGRLKEGNKHFIRDYKIITSFGQEGVGLESGPSYFAYLSFGAEIAGLCMLSFYYEKRNGHVFIGDIYS